MLAAAMVLVIGLALWPFPGSEDPAQGRADLLEFHQDWASEEIEADPDDAAVPAAANRDSGLYVPDLSAADVSLVAVRRLPAGDDAGVIHLGYLGSRGCRISLFSSPGGGLERTQSLASGGESPQWVQWSAGERKYLLVASGMARGRLEQLTTTLIEGSREHAQPDEELRMAMARSRERSEPCVG